MAPTGIQLFAVGERALCDHQKLIYECKILKVETWDETNTKSGILGPHYWVHYKGWKATWDEWVNQERLMKWNDVNLAKQKAINSETQAAEKKSKANAQAKEAAKNAAASAGAGGRRDARGGGTDSRKRKRDDDDGVRRPELKLVIPDLLKVVLVDDWEYITRNQMTVPLPRTPNVQQVLDLYGKYVMQTPERLSQTPQVLPTLIAGLQTYFDRALGSILLYRFERAQYAEMRKKFVTGQHVKPGDNRTMSTIYGAEHLARLLVKLPEMVSHTTMDEASVALLRDYVTDLMNWMVQHKEELFVAEYEHPPPSYTNISRT